MDTEHKHLVQLRQVLTERFDEGELRTLCFDLDVDFDSLPGEGKADKARELVAYLERRDRISDLINTGRRLRPDVADWSQAQLDVDMERLRARRDQADRARREMRECQRVVNLRPLDVTHTFKDRLREIQALCQHLTDESVRLVSIVGRGGMGKTALASRVLGDLERGVLPVPDLQDELLIDGILYLSAGSTGLGLERIYTDVGRMLGEPVAKKLAARWASADTPLSAKVEYLLESMQDGLYLILLDNLEDELTAEGEIAQEGLRLFVERCLTMPSGARLLATSREQVKVVAAALRNARSIPLRKGLPEDEAIAFLRDLDPDRILGLHDEPADELCRAVQLTQGIPRALEILVGILREDPAPSLSRLLSNEDLFGEEIVEQLVAEGYRRLGENERRVIEALAVFDRPVEETAIAFLLHPCFPGMDVRASLRRLVSGYFVSASRVTGEYELHPIDRDYAYRSLPDGADTDAYNQRNLELRAADFYASIRKPKNEWKSIDDLTPQLAEFDHRIRGGDYSVSLSVIAQIDEDNLYRWGHYSQLVDMRRKLVKRLIKPELEVDNSYRLGSAYRALGQVRNAIELYEQALLVAKNITGDNRSIVSTLLGSLGNAYIACGNIEKAFEYLKRALVIDRAQNDRETQTKHLSNMAFIYRILGKIGLAKKRIDYSLYITRRFGYRQHEGSRIGALGTIHRELGQIEVAVEKYKQALSLAKGIRYRREHAVQLCNLGDLCCDLRHVVQAIGLYEEALAIAQEIGYRGGEARYLSSLAEAYRIRGEVDKAIERYNEALAISQEIDDPRGKSYQLLGLSRTMLVSGSISDGLERSVEARDLEWPETSYRAATLLAIALRYQNVSAAFEAFQDAAERCRVILNETTNLVRPRYALALSQLGQVISNPTWEKDSEREELLAIPLDEYRRALEICDAPGVVGDAICDLELIRAAGIEGLEPVFELLESALADSQSKWAEVTVMRDE